jgi:hypothetical protein
VIKEIEDIRAQLPQNSEVYKVIKGYRVTKETMAFKVIKGHRGQVGMQRIEDFRVTLAKLDSKALKDYKDTKQLHLQ